MSDKPNIPSPQYSLIEALSTCLALAQRALAEVRALARVPGPAGPPGPRGRDAANFEVFKNHIDQAVARMFSTVSVTSPDGGRTQCWIFGDTMVELKTATVLDAGVWKDGTAYVRGDGVTSGGSFWIAQADTSAKPGGDGEDWRLAVKRGRDGKDGKGERGV